MSAIPPDGEPHVIPFAQLLWLGAMDGGAGSRPSEGNVALARVVPVIARWRIVAV